jgi:hypothetical protein
VFVLCVFAPPACLAAATIQVTSLDDMRRFILEHSDFSRAQGNVTKHVNIVTQLSEVIGARHLMDVSTVSGCCRVLLLLLLVGDCPRPRAQQA